MAVPNTVRANGGPYDVVYSFGDHIMGFRTANPPPSTSINNLAPNVRFGGDPGYQEGAYNQVVLNGFNHGGDRRLYESDDQRYQWSDGNVALYREKTVQLASQWASSDAGVTATARQIVDYPVGNEYVLVGVGTKCRAYDLNSLTWGNSGTFGADVIHLFATDDYVFASCGAGDDFWRLDDTTWTQPHTGAKANCFAIYKEQLYRGLSDEIIPYTNQTGAGAGVGTAIKVGWASTDVEDMWVANGYLLIAKPEGVYIYDGTNLELLIDAAVTRTTGNFVGSCEHEGATYLLWLNSIRKCMISGLHSATFTQLTPHMEGDLAKETYGHGKPVIAFSAPNKMYIAMDDGENVYPELLAHTGIGFYQVYRGTSGDTMNAAGYSRLMGWLLVNDGATRRKRVINVADGEYPDFALTGQFTTPAYDAGFPDIPKSYRDLTVQLRDVDADNTVKVEYRIDEGTWTTVYTLAEEGENTLMLGGVDAQVRGKKIEFRFTLTRDAADVTKTPIIEMPLVMRVLVCPEVTMAYTDTPLVDNEVSLWNDFELGSDDPTLDARIQFIKDMASTADTVTRINEWGKKTLVKVTSFSRVPKRLEDPGGSDERCDYSISLLDVFRGTWQQVAATLNATVTTTVTANTIGLRPGIGSPGFVTIGGSA